ncbi:MAG: SPASM domain-containing protein [Lentisphaeria bacterium]|nr:SPASM domain-containing protein [Lentisphaeria bacterium]
MHLTLHVTSRCNLRCDYCYDARHQGGDMTPETMRAAVAFACEQTRGTGHEDSIGVSFYGGEPLLVKDLIAETVRHCRSVTDRAGQLFHFKITTNGILLDEDFLTGPDTRNILVALSHDGTQKAHDTHRVDPAGNGTFQHLDHVTKILLREKRYSPVMLTVTPATVDDYAASVRYLFNRGFRYIICTLDFSANWTPLNLRALKHQYRRLATWYEKEMDKESKFYFSPFDTKISSHINPGSCRHGRCDFGRRQISVAPNGRLYPCVQFVGDGEDDTYCVGDVRRGLDTDKHAALYAENHAAKPACADCAARDRCNHFCGCLNWQVTGSLGAVAPVVCAHERTVLPITDKLAERLFRHRNSLFIQKHYNDDYPFLSLLEDSLQE